MSLLVLGSGARGTILAAEPPLAFQSPDGRRTVAVAEARAAITLDGSLDEEVWRTVEAATDFVQAEPHEGQPATERTEVRLLYDRDALYVPVPLPSEL